MIIVGLPLYVLELSLGQFSQTGITKLWSAVPFFQGNDCDTSIVDCFIMSVSQGKECIVSYYVYQLSIGL